KHEYYALPAFPALALLAGAAWASGRDIGRWLGIGMLGCGAVGVWALWLGGGLTPAQVMSGLAELNVYYRILRDQGVPFPFASPRPFSRLLLVLGLTLLVGCSVAALRWGLGLRRWVLVLRRRAPGGEGRLHRYSGPGPAVGGAAAGVPRGSAPGGRKRRRGATARRCARARALRLALALLEPLEAAGASGGTPD